MTPLELDDLEWRSLEEAPFDGERCAPKFSNVPHPLSAYCNLPMRGICHSKSSTQTDRDGNAGVYVLANEAVQKRNAIALWPEPKRPAFRSPCSGKIVKEPKPVVRPAAPHPRSYRPDLPLHGMGLEGQYPVRAWTLTASEKAILANRPLKYIGL